MTRWLYSLKSFISNRTTYYRFSEVSYIVDVVFAKLYRNSSCQNVRPSTFMYLEGN